MLIGIVGLIGSGKGTVGDYLHKEWGYEKDSFAKPLKDAVSIIFGWERDLLEGDTDMSRAWREVVDPYWSEIIGREMTPRLALQLFGTECIREVFDPNVWSASLIKRTTVDTVVTDCRFRNEIDAISKAKGIIFRVTRGEYPEWMDEYLRLYSKDDWDQINKSREEGTIPHISETDWIGAGFDYVIQNDGTLAELYERIDIIMEIEG